MYSMVPRRLHVSQLLILCLTSVEGVPQRFSVEADGHLAVAVPAAASAEGSLLRKADKRGSSLVEGVALFSENRQNLSGTPSKSGSGLQCGWTAFAPDDPCPSECPLLAEESWNPCHFQCVSEESCGVLDPKAAVADYKQGRCRRCIVSGCDVCSLSGKDKCSKCMMGYILDDNGECFSGGRYIWTVIETVGIQFVTVLLLWFLELWMRRPTNLKGLRHGMKFRKRTRCHMPRDTPRHLGVIDQDDSSGMLYPLSTNLLVTPVGGAGCCLHFNFQAYCIVWGAVFCMSWAYFASSVGYDLIKLGTLPAHTPKELCAVIRWGAKRQEAMFLDKYYYIIYIYAFQFISCVAFALFQHFRFHKLDNNTTMKDFACFVYGLPAKTGEEDVEGIFKDWLARETGQKVLGVSVAWNMMKRNDAQEVETALEIEAAAQEKEHLELKMKAGQEEEEEEVVLALAPATHFFKHFDKAFGFTGKEPEEPPETDKTKLRELLERMKTSDTAFAVFETEAARDAAVTLAQERRGFMFEKNVVRLETKACEPGTVRWHGLSLGTKTRKRNLKMLGGAGIMVVMLALWCFLFYLPYAYYVSSFSYANGNEPSAVANIVFTLLVVAGNQVMYFAADWVSVWCNFGFEDDREYWYNVYYLCACVTNVLADMIVTGYLSYQEMVGLGVHTADGQLLGSLTKFQDIIESYPMQKTMGRLLFAYCFPGTFLAPFILEPLGTIFAPYYLGRFLLRNHREYQGREAEKSMAFFAPMNLGRYSDIILNLTCSVLVLFLPGGYVMPIFLALVLSHIYIFYMDSWRVLRAVPNFCYSRNVCDQFAMNWMALPCALTLTAAVFKGYHIYAPELSGISLLCVLSWAFFGHIAMHITIIRKIYAMKGDHAQSDMTYDQVAKYEANTWFSVNPIHCLRSKYIWGHQPSQVYHIAGKEHLQRANPAIHSYFEDTEAQEADAPTGTAIMKKSPSGKHNLIKRVLPGGKDKALAKK